MKVRSSNFKGKGIFARFGEWLQTIEKSLNSRRIMVHISLIARLHIARPHHIIAIYHILMNSITQKNKGYTPAITYNQSGGCNLFKIGRPGLALIFWIIGGIIIMVGVSTWQHFTTYLIWKRIEKQGPMKGHVSRCYLK